MRACFGRLCLIELVITLVAAAASTMVLASDNVAAVLDAWQRRTEKARSFWFEWNEVRTLSRGAEREDPSAPVPPAEVSHNFTHKLVVHGDRMRYEFDGLAYEPLAGPGLFLHRRDISVSGGTAAKTYRGYSEIDDVYPYPQGRVFAEDNNYYVGELGLWPVFTSLRPLDAVLGDASLKEYRWTNKRGIVNARDCVILERTRDATYRELLLVDPARQFIVLRYQLMQNEKLLSEHTVNYVSDPEIGWVPNEWRWVALRLTDGLLNDSRSCTVTTFVLNAATDKEEFEFAFPPGTWVRDYLLNQEYIQREGGKRRIIMPGETGNYEDFLRTASGDLLGGRGLASSKRLPWFLMVNGVIILALALLMVRRAYKRRRA